MNSSGIVLTFDNLTGENIGTIRLLFCSFYLFRFISVNWNCWVWNNFLWDKILVTELWLLKAARANANRNCEALPGRLILRLPWILRTLSSAHELALTKPGPAFSGGPPDSGTTPPHHTPENTPVLIQEAVLFSSFNGFYFVLVILLLYCLV